MFKSRKIMIITACVIISCTLLFAAGCDADIGFYESSDISTYRNFNVPGAHSLLLSFPENLEKVETVNDYYFVANFPPFGRTSWELFLDVTYTEDNFYSEWERLANFPVESSYRTEHAKRGLKFDDKSVLFNYPAYVTEYDTRYVENQTYEYICIDEPNFSMIYVYLERPSRINQMTHYREIVIPSEYQPKNYFKNKDESTLDGYYYTVYTGLDTTLVWFE